MRLEAKVAVVTGGSQGIGAAIARRYGAEGAKVAIVNRTVNDRTTAVIADIEAAGGTMADIVKVNIFVTKIDDRKKVWRARREFFSGDFPVSTLVEVSALALPEMEVEVEAVAILHAGTG